MYTEVHTEDVAISLFIKRLSDDDAGQYRQVNTINAGCPNILGK